MRVTLGDCNKKSTLIYLSLLYTVEVGSVDRCLLFSGVSGQQPCSRRQETDAQPLHVRTHQLCK